MAYINPSTCSRGCSEVERKILELWDIEKRRIGQDLHDGVGQLMTGIGLMSKALEHRLRESGSPEADEVHKIAELADEVVNRIREVVAGLAPLGIQNQDAATALSQLCRRIEQVYHIRCIFSDMLSSLPVTEPNKVKNLYFIATESIHNAIRHGDADQIEVRLRPGSDSSQGELIIKNNGSCDPDDFAESNGIGLSGMHFRAEALNGRLNIERYPDHTIAVICSFSLDNLPPV
ncbi:MAG: histidine kinase [Kiritimatiellales bacterium]|jgi:signal transduction histidine kinase